MKSLHITLILCLILGSTAMAQPPRRATTARNSNYNDRPYGMNAFHPNGPAPHGHLVHFTPENMKRLEEADIRWVRLMVDWRYLEPQKGTFYWESLDRVVKICNDRNIGILACLYEPPDWALLDTPDQYRVKPEDFRDFGKAIATRYKGKIAAYEVYNERPTGSGWPNIAPRRADLFVEILKGASTGIKAGDPDALVLMTGLWQFPMYYLEDVYKAGAKDYFDAVSLHYYLGVKRDPHSKDAFRGDLETYLKFYDHVTKKYDDAGKPIWFTEYGWPATDESQVDPVGDEKMAEYTKYFLETCRDSGLVEKTIWYVYYLSDGMAMWHTREDRKRPVWYVHKQFQEDYLTWVDLPTEPLSYPPAATLAPKIPGGDLESADAWTLPAGEAAAFVNADPKAGQAYLKLTATDGPVEATGQAFDLEPGRAYRLTGWVKMKGGIENPEYAHAMIHIELLKADGTSTGFVGPYIGERGNKTSTNYYLSDTDGKWYQVHYPIYTTPETAGGRIILKLGHADAPKGEAGFDAIRIEPLDLGEFDEEKS